MIFIILIKVFKVVFMLLFCNGVFIVFLNKFLRVIGVRLFVFGGLEVILIVVMVKELNLFDIIMYKGRLYLGFNFWGIICFCFGLFDGILNVL